MWTCVIFYALISNPIIYSTQADMYISCDQHHESYLGHQQTVFRNQTHKQFRNNETLWRHQQYYAALCKAQEYARRGIDPVWLTPAARDVALRCTVINYLNGPPLSKQIIPPSRLPTNFREDFSVPWILWERSAQCFYDQFNHKIRNCTTDECHAYARAEMRRWAMYKSSEFRAFLQELPVYSEYLLEIAAQFRYDEEFTGIVFGTCPEAIDWIFEEVQRIRSIQRILEAQARHAHSIRSTFQQQHEPYDNDTLIFLEKYQIPYHDRFVHRSCCEELMRSQHHYVELFYQLDDASQKLLQQSYINIKDYRTCYGNQLQQQIHQECITLVAYTASIVPQSPIFAYQSSIVEYIEAARLYNKAGLTYEASAINDFCFTLLDYGKALLEGAQDGLMSVIDDITKNPLPTLTTAALSTVAGEYLLAYQLSKLVYGILKLGATALINPQQAKMNLNEYFTPISSVIEALNNKEITLRTTIKAAATLTISIQAQAMLAKGCSKLYSTAKAQALHYITKNPLENPAQYMTTPENIGLRITHESCKPRNLAKNQASKTAHAPLNNDKNSIPEFILNNSVPRDKQTILGSPKFKRTNKLHQTARVYEKDGYYYYRDQLHKGKAAHLEVFHKNGTHLGEADPLTGNILPGTADPSKKINIK